MKQNCMQADQGVHGVLLLVMMLGFFVVGCQGNVFTHEGGVVRPQERIPLVEGSEVGSWGTRDLTFDYRYQRSQNQLSLDGTVRFGSHLTFNFPTILDFRMGVMLLDGQGTVLGKRGIGTSFSYSDATVPLRIREVMTVPAGTAAIAFFYTGEARGTGDDAGGGSPAPFWHYPDR